MGGAAFAGGPDPLWTPRMPAAVYATVRDRCHAALLGLFVGVATPIEGPGKADFGDVDVVVGVPMVGMRGDEDPLQVAARRLHAVRALYTPGKATLAVAWPADLGHLVPRTLAPTTTPSAIPHIQVDLVLTSDLAGFTWALFRHAHGDFWSILGTAMRPLGLTIDDSALWLRVPEIEAARQRRRARVRLTADPAQVLSFLGLGIGGDDDNNDNNVDGDTDGDSGCDCDSESGGGDSNGCMDPWDRPFASAAALFAYAATSPYFVVGEGTETGESELTTADRRRLRSRPLYAQWATQYVPAFRRQHPERVLPHSSVAAARARVRDAAFARFPGVEAFYARRLRTFQHERRTQQVWAAAKAAVPASLPPQLRAKTCVAIRQRLGLRRPSEEEVNVAGGGSGAASVGEQDKIKLEQEEAEEPEPAETDQDINLLPTVDGVTAFVDAHWAELAAEAAPEEWARYQAESARIACYSYAAV